MQRAVSTLRPPLYTFLAVLLTAAAACTGLPDETVEGTLQRSVIDRPDRGESRVLYMLHTRDGQQVELLFDQPRADYDAVELLPTGSVLRAQGRRLPPGAAEQPIHPHPSLQVNDYQVLAPPPDVQPLIVEPARRPPPRKLGVILFNFENDDRQPMTPQEVQRKIFQDTDSARAFYQEQSYGLVELAGKTGPQGEVFGYYTLPAINRPCSYANWGEMALTAARAAGVDTTGYDNLVFFFPATDACPFLGVGQQPGNSTWMNGFSVATFIHELGHNVGTPHASARTCSDPEGKRITLSAACRDAEYGNPFDVMGAGFHHTHAYNKAQARWLSGSNLQLIDKDGVYTLLAQERPSDGVQLLRIPRDETTFYYLEYRQPFGFDNFSAGTPAVSGVIVVIGTELRGLGKSLLLDMNADTSTLADAPLGLNKSYLDAKAGVKLTVMALSPDSAQVKVELTPPTAAAGER